MRRGSIRLLWARKLMPRLFWSGAGTIINKTRYDGAGGGVSGAELANFWSGSLGVGSSPTRWILTVLDDSGKLHTVFVAERLWDEHYIGDVITADDPLLDVRS